MSERTTTRVSGPGSSTIRAPAPAKATNANSMAGSYGPARRGEGRPIRHCGLLVDRQQIFRFVGSKYRGPIRLRSVLVLRTAGAGNDWPWETALPLYRAAHRQPTGRSAPTAIRLRQPRNRRSTMSDELARPEALAAAIELDQLRLFYHPIVALDNTRSSATRCSSAGSTPSTACSRRWTSCRPSTMTITSADCSAPGYCARPARPRCSAASNCCSASTSHRGTWPNPDFADHVMSVLQATGLPAERLDSGIDREPPSSNPARAS